MKIGNATLIGQSAGFGVPTGGTAGFVLVKKSGTSYDTEWVQRQDSWIQSTITITSTGSPNPTKGTVTTDIMRYRQVAPKEFEIDMLYYQTGGGGAGNGDYLFTLPGGLQFSSNQYWFNTNTGGIDSSAVKVAAVVRGSQGVVTNSFATGAVIAVVYDATRFKLIVNNSIANSALPNNVIKSDYLQMGSSATVTYSIRFTFTAA
jgi:hypothetical protein